MEKSVMIKNVTLVNKSILKKKYCASFSPIVVDYTARTNSIVQGRLFQRSALQPAEKDSWSEKVEAENKTLLKNKRLLEILQKLKHGTKTQESGQE